MKKSYSDLLEAIIAAQNEANRVFVHGGVPIRYPAYLVQSGSEILIRTRSKKPMMVIRPN